MGSAPLNFKDNLLPLYFQQDYINVHANENIVVYKNSDFLIPLTLSKNIANSFRQSPFGSFFNLNNSSFETFIKFEQDLSQYLLKKGIQKIHIRHPPVHYHSFIPPEWLKYTGYQVISKDINQHISLPDYNEALLHKMEERKLRNASRETLLFSHDTHSSLMEIHSFIAMCRADAGLSINISVDKLTQLFQTFPTNYSLYSVRKNHEIMAACVIAQPQADIYYYYLPATHPEHKSKSPMVLLLISLVETFKSKGARLFDLGLSSIDGQKQKGLFDFKKRMGANEASSFVFEKEID